MRKSHKYSGFFSWRAVFGEPIDRSSTIGVALGLSAFIRSSAWSFCVHTEWCLVSLRSYGVLLALSVFLTVIWGNDMMKMK